MQSRYVAPLLLMTGFAPAALSAQFTQVSSAVTGATVAAGSDLWFLGAFQQTQAGPAILAEATDSGAAMTAALVNSDSALTNALTHPAAVPSVAALSGSNLSGGEPNVDLPTGLSSDPPNGYSASGGDTFSGSGESGSATSVTPEPATIVLLATGLAVIGLFGVLRNAA